MEYRSCTETTLHCWDDCASVYQWYIFIGTDSKVQCWSKRSSYGDIIHSCHLTRRLLQQCCSTSFWPKLTGNNDCPWHALQLDAISSNEGPWRVLRMWTHYFYDFDFDNPKNYVWKNWLLLVRVIAALYHALQQGIPPKHVKRTFRAFTPVNTSAFWLTWSTDFFLRPLTKVTADSTLPMVVWAAKPTTRDVTEPKASRGLISMPSIFRHVATAATTKPCRSNQYKHFISMACDQSKKYWIVVPQRFYHANSMYNEA